MTGLAGDPQRRFPGRKCKSGISCRVEVNGPETASQGVLECANAINVQSMNRPLTDASTCDALGETDFERTPEDGEEAKSGQHRSLQRTAGSKDCEASRSGGINAGRSRREDGQLQKGRLRNDSIVIPALGRRTSTNQLGRGACHMPSAWSQAERLDSDSLIIYTQCPKCVDLIGTQCDIEGVASAAVSEPRTTRINRNPVIRRCDTPRGGRVFSLGSRHDRQRQLTPR
jgi:hypothetical protein